MFSVLIDTSAYEELRLSFKDDIFDSLIKLSQEQKIIIVSSIIIYEEMKAHLKESITTSVNKIDRVSKTSAGFPWEMGDHQFADRQEKTEGRFIERTSRPHRCVF